GDAIARYRAEWAGVRDGQDNVWRRPLVAPWRLVRRLQQHHLAVKVQEALLLRRESADVVAKPYAPVSCLIPSLTCGYAATIRMDGKTMWHLPETLREMEEAGDDSIVLELIAFFQDDTASRIERLHAAVARLDAPTVKAEAHAMRGSARQMGAEALADLCQTIEAGVLKMNWPELEGQVHQAD